MRKFLFACGMISLMLFTLTACGSEDPAEEISRALHIDVSAGEEISSSDTHGGFQYSAQMAHFLHQLCIDERNIGADLGPDLNEPPLRQLQLCFPEGGAAHPQLFAQFRLVQFFTRLQTGIDNIIDQYPQNKTFCRFMLSAL